MSFTSTIPSGRHAIPPGLVRWPGSAPYSPKCSLKRIDTNGPSIQDHARAIEKNCQSRTRLEVSEKLSIQDQARHEARAIGKIHLVKFDAARRGSQNRDSKGLTCTRFGSPGTTWFRLDSLVDTLTRMDSLGHTCMLLDSLDSLGLTWPHWT